MIVAVDTSVLLLFLAPHAPPPRLAGGAEPLPHARERIEHLIATLDEEKARILVPTPVLSEVLVHANAAAPRYLEIIARSGCFQVVDFDQRAAVELAAMTRQAIAEGDYRAGSSSPRQKIKIDRQIVAVAKVWRAAVLYSDDEDVARIGQRAAIRVVTTSALPIPAEITQGRLDFS